MRIQCTEYRNFTKFPTVETHSFSSLELFSRKFGEIVSFNDISHIGNKGEITVFLCIEALRCSLENFVFFYLSGFSFTTTHESQDCRGRGRAFFNSSSRPLTNHRTAGEGGGHSLTPHYHFHPLHRHYLDISRTITAESSPLHIRNSRSRTGSQLISLLHFCFFI